MSGATGDREEAGLDADWPLGISDENLPRVVQSVDTVLVTFGGRKQFLAKSRVSRADPSPASRGRRAAWRRDRRIEASNEVQPL
jgi:hypothetical protein